MAEEKFNTREEQKVEDIPVVQKLNYLFGDAILGAKIFRGEVTILVDKKSLLDICKFLKTNPEFELSFLADVVGVDYRNISGCFEVVYHLCSYTKKNRLRLKVQVKEDEKVPSVTSIWRSANFAEREVYDMYGIQFEGHPDLRRIYMPQDWEGYPLRKDYPITGYKDQYNPFGVERKEQA